MLGSLIQFLTALVVLSGIGVSPALAHSFDVDIVFPGLAPAELRDGFLREFRRASAERDAHSNEESDGHLGGLDVYSRVLLISEAERRLTGAFVVLAPGVSCGSAMAIAAPTAVVIDMERLAAMTEAASHRADYGRRYGTLPDDAALDGYLVARQIDVIVRELGGVDDIAALRDRTGSRCD
jgi:hypothetical protein